ncbi:MAG TPA: hypothetical protein VIU62_07785, partial [Chloroflexota bacterium]
RRPGADQGVHMTDVSRAEAALVIAKAKCFKTCGDLDPAVASDRSLAERAHEEHRVALEEAYAAFQAESAVSPSNPASGHTKVSAQLTVDSGLN